MRRLEWSFNEFNEGLSNSKWINSTSVVVGTMTLHGFQTWWRDKNPVSGVSQHWAQILVLVPSSCWDMLNLSSLIYKTPVLVLSSGSLCEDHMAMSWGTTAQAFSVPSHFLYIMDMSIPFSQGRWSGAGEKWDNPQHPPPALSPDFPRPPSHGLGGFIQDL